MARLRFPKLTKQYLNTFPAVHLKKMDAWDYAWLLSSEFLVITIVLVVAGFNILIFRGGQVNDQSLANTFLGYHANQNPQLYAQTASMKTLVIQKNDFVREASASNTDSVETITPKDVSEPELVQNDNTLVVQNPDSITELLKKQVKIYKTQTGDTLGSIARQFDVNIQTIIWANNLPGITIHPGWDLLIPQTDGLIIEAGPNTTLPDIANKYKGNLEEIIAYNGLSDAQDINEGDYIFCKGCIIPTAQPKPVTKPTSKKQIGIADETVLVIAGGHVFPKGYCTYYVAKRVKITFGGNAKNWLSNGKAAGYATGNEPRPGSIVVTTDNQRYGHVAYVKQVTSSHIIVDEMNFIGFNKVSSRSIAINSKTIRGYVYPKY